MNRHPWDVDVRLWAADVETLDPARTTTRSTWNVLGAFYETLSKSDQFALYLRLVTARTKKTRLARLERMTAAMARGNRLAMIR